MTAAPEASETSRSDDSPPTSTPIFLFVTNPMPLAPSFLDELLKKTSFPLVGNRISE
jgi:hypothetical protein